MRTKDFDGMLAEFDKKRPDLASTRPERVKGLLTEHDSYQQVLTGLRKASKKTQSEVARALGISQPRVSELEKSRDLYLSTLNNYVRALGGELEFVVNLHGQRIVVAAEDVLGLAADAESVASAQPDHTPGADRALEPATVAEPELEPA